MNNYQWPETMPIPNTAPPASEIKAMFNRLASRYDTFNRLTSLGLDVIWRKETVRPIKPGMKILDLGCGTGDLTLEAAKNARPGGQVLGIDFSENMLAYARTKWSKKAPGSVQVSFECRRAEELPFAQQRFHGVISGFVLRNIYENIDAILDGVYESLMPGGFISFVDITEPPSVFLKSLWKIYMKTGAALFGKLLFGRDYPTSYLTESANRFMKAPEFMEKLKEKGFDDVRSTPFLFGIIRLYQAKRPQ